MIMMTSRSTPAEMKLASEQEQNQNDARLVAGSLAGDRDAFAQIVSRYQSLICSMTYSATGNFGWSEDLAQETFITAWRQLAQLREPQRLRSWLCGIARNLINSNIRKQQREIATVADPLDAVQESKSPDLPPSDQAISREEETIVWNALEKIPEIY